MMSNDRSLVIDNIGLLVTNDATRESGLLGVVSDASIVVNGGEVVEIGPAGLVADDRIDADGACVMPGFVDSHTHLVFAGDRSEEFAARMAGEAYAAGGIGVTTAATRSADNATLRELTADRINESLRAGITTTEIKTGYGLTVDHEIRLARIAAEFSSDVTFLGAHLVPEEYRGRADAYVDLVTGAMLDAVSDVVRFVDVFCEEGAFDEDQSRAVLAAGAALGLRLKVHGNQLGFGRGVQLAVEMGATSVDHCTYLSDEDVAALADSSTVATFLPAADFSTRQPYPDARRVIDAGATVAIATNCNPGSSYTTSMGFCLALAVRDMGMTIDEAVWAATAGGAAALDRSDIGVLQPGSRADLIQLSAPSPNHFVYRPGVPIVERVFVGGVER